MARRPRPRVHGDMLTVAIRGPLAAKMRGLADTTGTRLARLVSDMILACAGEMNIGYEAVFGAVAGA